MIKTSLRKLKNLTERRLGLYIHRRPKTAVFEEMTELTKLVPYSLCGERVLWKLYALSRDLLARDVPGDFVECGVHNGGSAATVACAFRDSGRMGWLFDSYEGMPETTEKDGDFAAQFVGTYRGSEEKTKEALQIAGIPEDRYVIRKGWFRDTFCEALPRIVAFLHIDCDWYDSVSMALNTFYDRVAEGGVIVLDDFGHFEGCREAYYDFVQRRGLKPLIERFGHSQAYWVKGRAHNRPFVGKWEIP